MRCHPDWQVLRSGEQIADARARRSYRDVTTELWDRRFRIDLGDVAPAR